MQQDSPASTNSTKSAPAVPADLPSVNAVKVPRVICPRCGYDLRGIIAAWETSCPLRGTCAECGLQYDWIDVINPSRIKPMWCVEYASGRVGWAMSACKTFTLQCVPWLFWRRVRMHHQPRFRRIAAYLLLLVLTVYVAMAVHQGVAAAVAYYECHMTVHPMPGVPMPSRPPPPPPAAISIWEAVGWSMLLPVSSTSPGGYLLCGFWWSPFPPPLELLQDSWKAGWYTYPGQRSKLKNFGLLANFWLILLLLMPLTFALLPQTRRTAKVRWAHIIRIGLYGAALTAPLLWWVAIWQVPESGFFPFLLLVSINLIWWGFACSAYLQLPRPWLVASLLTFMLMLIAIAFQHYAFGSVFITTVMSV